MNAAPLHTTVVNLKVHTYDVYIGRRGHGHDGYFGNPAGDLDRRRKNVSEGKARYEALHGFLQYFRHRMGLVWNAYWSQQAILLLQDSGEWRMGKVPSNDKVFKDRVRDLRGKRLGCFCLPALCHGHVYAAWLNSGPLGLAKFEEQLALFKSKL